MVYLVDHFLVHHINGIRLECLQNLIVSCDGCLGVQLLVVNYASQVALELVYLVNVVVFKFKLILICLLFCFEFFDLRQLIKVFFEVLI